MDHLTETPLVPCEVGTGCVLKSIDSSGSVSLNDLSKVTRLMCHQEEAGRTSLLVHNPHHCRQFQWGDRLEKYPRSLSGPIPSVTGQNPQIQRNEEARLFSGQAGLGGSVSEFLEECRSIVYSFHSECHCFVYILSSQGSEGHRDDLRQDALAGLTHQSHWVAVLFPMCRGSSVTLKHHSDINSCNPYRRLER